MHNLLRLAVLGSLCLGMTLSVLLIAVTAGEIIAV